MNKYMVQHDAEDRNGGKDKKHEKFVRTNWKIKAYTCRLVEDGKVPRLMPTRDAMSYAQSLGLDLVELGYDYRSDTSTCRVCDYGKFVYEQKQKEKQARKQARANQVDIKTLQISLTTDTADLERIVSRAKDFLAAGDKVKLTLRFRGRREIANVGMGKEVMKKLLVNFDGIAVLDAAPTLCGRELSCVLRRGQQKKVPAQARPNMTITVS